MIRVLLDTDHVSLHERGHLPLRARLASLPPEDVAVSVVTVEEMLRGRLAILARRSTGEARVHAYTKLLETVQFFSTITVMPFDMACEQQFQALRATQLRVGSRDLRIAATALVHSVVLITRNRRDFEQVPGLRLDDWSLEWPAPTDRRGGQAMSQRSLHAGGMGAAPNKRMQATASSARSGLAPAFSRA